MGKGSAAEGSERCLANRCLGRRKRSGGLSSGNGRGAVMDLFDPPSNGVMMFVMTPFFIQQNGGTGFRHVRESLCRIWLTGLWPETKGEPP